MSENGIYFLLMGLASVGIFLWLYFRHPKCAACGRRIHRLSRACPACGAEQPGKPDR